MSGLRYLVIFISLFLSACLKEAPSASNAPASVDSVSNTRQLVLVEGPSSETAGTVFSVVPKVEIRDSSGRIVTTGADAYVTLTIEVSTGTGALVGTTSSVASEGIAVFPGLAINSSGQKILKVVKQDTSMAGGSGTANAFSGTVTISPRSPAKLAVESSGSVLPGVCHPVTVNSVDEFGNQSAVVSSKTIQFSNFGYGAIYSDAACTTSVTSTTIASATSQKTVYFKNSAQEQIRLVIDDESNQLTSVLKDLSVGRPELSNFFMNSNSLFYPIACATYDSGSAFCSEQLGVGGYESGLLGYTFPGERRFVSLNESVVEMALGLEHTCARTSNGKLYCWGGNSEGQLGQGTTAGYSVLTPPEVGFGGLAPVQIAAVKYSTCAIVSNGTTSSVRCWGFNGLRQLGDLTTTNRTSPVTAQLGLAPGVEPVQLVSNPWGNAFIAVLNNGTAMQWGRGSNPTLLPYTGIKSIVSYDDPYSSINSSCAITTSNTVKCRGPNDQGMLGQGDLTDRGSSIVDVPGLTDIAELAIQGSHVCARKTNGETYCWGAVSGSQYGSGTVYRPTPSLISSTLRLSKLATSIQDFCGLTMTAPKDLVCWSFAKKRPIEVVSYFNLYHRLNVTSSSQYSVPEFCSALSLSVLRNGAASSLGSDLTVGLSLLGGNGSYYNDSACLVPISQTSIVAGQSTRSVYFKSGTTTSRPTSNVLKLSSSLAGVSNGGFGIEGSGSPYSLSVYSEVSSDTDYCVSLDVYLVDQHLNLTKSTTATPVQVSTTGNVIAYTDSACTTPATTVAIPAGSTSVRIYHKITAACGAGNINLSAPSLPGEMSSPEVVGFTRSAYAYESCGCD